MEKWSVSRLSKEILLRRAGVWLTWVRGATSWGLRQLVEYPLISYPAVLLMISGPLLALRLVARPRVRADAEALHRMRSLACLALAAVGFFLTYLTLTSCVSFPFRRYFVSTVLFIPSALVAILFECWRVLADLES